MRERRASLVAIALAVGLMCLGTDGVHAANPCDTWQDPALYNPSEYEARNVQLLEWPVRAEIGVLHHKTTGRWEVVGMCLDTSPVAPGALAQSTWVQSQLGPDVGTPGQWYGAGLIGQADDPGSSGGFNYHVGVGTNPYVLTSPGSGGAIAEVAIPVTIACVNSFCDGLAQTGVATGTVVVGGAPADDVGQSVSVTDVHVWVDGLSVFGPASVTAGAVANPGSVAASPVSGSVPVCIAGICQPLPTLFPLFVGLTGEPAFTVTVGPLPPVSPSFGRGCIVSIGTCPL